MLNKFKQIRHYAKIYSNKFIDINDYVKIKTLSELSKLNELSELEGSDNYKLVLDDYSTISFNDYELHYIDDCYIVLSDETLGIIKYNIKTKTYEQFHLKNVTKLNILGIYI